MLIGVVGGTGTAGKSVVREALSRGHDVRVLTRAHAPRGLPDGAEFQRVVVASGDGLPAALTGVEVVIDCGNLPEFMSKKKLAAYFEQGTRNLSLAEAAAGVDRHVVLSIVGIDQVPMPYYRAKLAQERLATLGPVPAAVVRSTQFHDFAGQIIEQTRIGPLALVPDIAIQPVATSEVARVLLDVAQDPDPVARTQIAGPKQMSLVDAARQLAASTPGGPRIVPLPIPGKTGRALRVGALTLPEGPTAGPDFEGWLEQRGQ